MPIDSENVPKIFHPSLTPWYENAEGSKFGVVLRASALPIQQPPDYNFWGILEGGIRPTQCPNAKDPKIIYNQEI